MKQTFLKSLLALCTILNFFNCEKEEAISEQKSIIETVSIHEAQSLFNDSKNSIISKSSKAQYANPNLNYISQEEINNSDKFLTIIPAYTFDNVYSRILLLKIDGSIKSVIISMVQDENSDTNQFTGKLYITDLDGKYINAFRITNGVLVSRFLKPIDPNSKSSKSLVLKGSEDGCWGIACGMEGEEVLIIANKPKSINYLQIEALFDRGGGNYSWDAWPDGGGSSGSTNTNCSNGYIKDSYGNCVPAFSIDLSNTSKIDPIEELKCFDLTKGAKLIIYVQQPEENSSTIYSGQNGPGHAFIGIEQNSIVRQLGFYPESGANSAFVGVGKPYKSELRSNNDYLYHVSISKVISSSQLTSITNYIKKFPEIYDVNNYACTDFAIKIGNLAGMGLPSTTMESWPFKGRSPGQLGQEIRAMDSDGIKTISKTKSISPSKKGDCN